MYRPGTDQTNVQMSDVLCDFCHRAWTEDVPFVEGHRGAVICGRCLEIAWLELHTGSPNVVTEAYFCRLSREGEEDRAALNRPSEPGWRSPVDPEAVVSRKCVLMAAATLQKDADSDWRKPDLPPGADPRDPAARDRDARGAAARQRAASEEG